MGARQSAMLQPEELAEICGETGFSRRQVIRLYDRFNHLDRENNGRLNRQDFSRIPELVINPLFESIVNSLFLIAHPEEPTLQTVDFRQWVRALAVFRPLKKKELTDPASINSRKNKIKFAFSLYDQTRKGFIDKEAMIEILHMMVGEHIPVDQLMAIADKTLQEADRQSPPGQGCKIYPEDFEFAMEKVEVETKMAVRFLS